MKKPYVKPAMVIEEFVPNEYVSTCYAITTNVTQYCIDDSEVQWAIEDYWNQGEEHTPTTGTHYFKSNTPLTSTSVYIPQTGAHYLQANSFVKI